VTLYEVQTLGYMATADEPVTACVSNGGVGMDQDRVKCKSKSQDRACIFFFSLFFLHFLCPIFFFFYF
jgi:hypothetical protein